MHEIIEKTFELIDELENSEMIKKLVESKKKILEDRSLLKEISKMKNLNDNELIVSRKKLFQNEYYRTYLSCYNELNFFVRDFNIRMREIISPKECIK